MPGNQPSGRPSVPSAAEEPASNVETVAAAIGETNASLDEITPAVAAAVEQQAARSCIHSRNAAGERLRICGLGSILCPEVVASNAAVRSYLTPLEPGACRFQWLPARRRQLTIETPIAEDRMFPMAALLPLYRDARRDDARALAQLIEIAGEGIPTYLWSQQTKPGQTPLDVGTERAARDSANFSYRNAVVAHLEGKVAGMLLAYRLPAPSAKDLAELPEMPPLLRPLVELEYQAPGTFYVNALAVFAPYRGRGIGASLLTIAQERAAAAGCDELSVQVFAENEGAERLYRRCGYAVVDRRPIIAHDCYPYSTEVLLMMRSTAA
jgi:ribosomal protein S18 acetylase RimI-like enzyme